MNKMKKLILPILILFCLTGSAQIIGVNGTNSPETKQEFKELQLQLT